MPICFPWFCRHGRVPYRACELHSFYVTGSHNADLAGFPAATQMNHFCFFLNDLYSLPGEVSSKKNIEVGFLQGFRG